MRLRGKVDRNQAEIVRALRQIGASVQSLADLGNGVPDLLVGLRGQTFLMEIKDWALPPSKKRLTEDEKTWHSLWKGGQVFIVECPEQALHIVTASWKWERGVEE